MNNGKVRIYELSRELNLDNKHILDICEDLNIAVKSHSSTITESEAERIRAASEKSSDRPTTVKSREGGASTEGRTGVPSHKFMNRPNGQLKQPRPEILRVKPKPGASSSSQQEDNRVTTPGQPPVKSSVIPPNKPTINRPSLVKPSEQPEHRPDPLVEPIPPASQETSKTICTQIPSAISAVSAVSGISG
jgi:translation initiation factor IF-2